MQIKLIWLWNKLTKPAVELKGVQRKQASLLAGMLLVFMLITCVSGVVFVVKSLTGTTNLTTLLMHGLALLLFSAAYFVNRTKYHMFTVWLSLVLPSIMILLFASVTPDISAYFILLLLVLPMMISATYLSFRSSLLSILVLFLFFIISGWFHNRVFLPPTENLPYLIMGIVSAGIVYINFQRNSMEKARLNQIKIQQERYRKMIESSSDAILQVTPQMEILFTNAAYFLTVGYTPEDTFFESGLKSILQTDLHALRAVFDTLVENGFAQLEYRVQHHSGEWIHRHVNYSIVLNEEKQPESMIAMMRDITERKKMEEQLKYIAMHDLLTGLPNRNLLMDRLNQALERSKRSGMLVVVLFLDLDNFKLINDTLGHQEGDLFLQVIANRLERSLRSCDTVGRWSGDEFIIILENIQYEKNAFTVAQKIKHLLSLPYERGGQLFQITASIGLCASNKCCDPEKMIDSADQALYQSKREGKNKISVY